MCEDYSSNFTFKISMFLSEAQKYMASKITEADGEKKKINGEKKI